MVNVSPGIMFGEFIKGLCGRHCFDLREFFLEHGHDPATEIRIERQALPRPCVFNVET